MHLPHRAPAPSRATFYGVDAWSIHKGSCGYGQVGLTQQPWVWEAVRTSAQSEGVGG